MNELASLMWRRADTQEREMLNLLVWATPALILSEDEAGTELHEEHHSRAAGLNQRLAAAGLDEWDGLIERAPQKQQEEEEKKNALSNQLEDKEQAYLRRGEQSNVLRAEEQIMIGSKHAAPCEGSTQMIQAKLPKEELPVDE